MDIGFIGLGNMGSGMAANLVKAGHTVLGFDVAGVGVDGVRKVASALDAARTTEIVITMLPNGQVLQAVAEKILPSMQSGKLFMDCSSVDVQSARTVHAKAASKSISCIDAPVSGGSAGADAGTLTFMAGGSKEAFERAQPLFDVMGKKAVHCGDAGAGQIAKICNNMILGVTMAVTGEAFALGQKLGLDPQKLFDVVSTSSGSSWSSNTYCPVPGVGPNAPSDNSYQPGFAAELMLKDLRLSQEAAVLADADTILGALATDIFERLVATDGAGKDFSFVFQSKLSGTREDAK